MELYVVIKPEFYSNHDYDDIDSMLKVNNMIKVFSKHEDAENYKAVNSRPVVVNSNVEIEGPTIYVKHTDDYVYDEKYLSSIYFSTFYVDIDMNLDIKECIDNNLTIKESNVEEKCIERERKIQNHATLGCNGKSIIGWIRRSSKKSDKYIIKACKQVAMDYAKSIGLIKEDENE